LTSNGIDSKEIENAFLKVLARPANELSSAYIANAWDMDEKKTGDWYPRECKLKLQHSGIKILDVDLRVLRGKELKNKLSKVDVIYVGGGNTYYLLDLIRKSNFDTMLPELLDIGKIYVGASAGSIVVGPDISMARDPRVVNLQDFRGMGIVPFVVIPHYVDYEGIGLSGREFAQLARKVLSPNPVVPVSNRQAVLVVGTEKKMIGKTPTLMFMEENPHKSPEEKAIEESLITNTFRRQIDSRLNKRSF
jgi:dipeptidase E